MKAWHRVLIVVVTGVVVGIPPLLGRAARANEGSLVGTWKLVSATFEDVQTKEQKAFLGEHPNGSAVFTPEGHLIVLITAEGRHAPQTAAERDAAFRSQIAYSGRYCVDGTKFLTKVDIAWNEAWVGTDQMRFFRLEGDRLSIETAPAPNLDFSGRMTRGILVWEREGK